jgi:hypothetical protein
VEGLRVPTIAVVADHAVLHLIGKPAAVVE